MTVRIVHAAFHPWQELQRHQEHLALAGEYGATSAFVGTMRDFNQGDPVTGLCLDYYPGMTERQLGKIIDEACRRWDVLGQLLIHRVGTVLPDETIVLVAVWAAHRGDAFDACRHIMEELKTTAPFWKKEQLASGQGRWVETNSPAHRLDTALPYRR